jgi:hypothetical protein
MKPREILEIAVRIVGLVQLLWGVGSIVEAIMYQSGLASAEGFSARYWAIRGVVECVTGLFLLLRSKHVVETVHRSVDNPN